MLLALRSFATTSVALLARRRVALRGNGGRASRSWLWGVLPYLWLALFSNPLHTHAPGQAAHHDSASTCTAPAAASDCPSPVASPVPLSPVGEESCSVCQWLSCAVAVGIVAVVLLASGGRNTFGRFVGLHTFGTLRGTRARGPPSSLLLSA